MKETVVEIRDSSELVVVLHKGILVDVDNVTGT